MSSRVHRGRSRQLLRCVHCGLLQMQGLLRGHLVRPETVLLEENRGLLLHRLGLLRVAMLRRGKTWSPMMRRGKSLLLGLLWQMSTVRMHPEALRRRRILLLRRRILRSLWLGSKSALDSNRTCLGQTLYMIIGCRDARRGAHPLNKATLWLGQLGVNFLGSENRRVLSRSVESTKPARNRATPKIHELYILGCV